MFTLLQLTAINFTLNFALFVKFAFCTWFTHLSSSY